MAQAVAPLRFGSGPGRWVIAATVGGSGMTFLDGTVVNVALPAIQADLDAAVSGLQWTLDGYLLSLAGLILLGGSLGDRFGRRRIFVGGVLWFTVASALCAVAPTVGVLVAGRVLQGVGAAMLTPGSLAILQASFDPDDRGRAIGAWSGLTGISAAVGPLVGGWLVTAASWRWIFLINLPISACVLFAARHVPESSNPESARLDGIGAATAAAGLGGVTFALIEAPARGWSDPMVAVAGVGGVLVLAGFLTNEARSSHPMLPLGIFRSRQFSGANAVTLGLYAALGAIFFLFVVFLQQVLGYSATASGAAMLPVTALMLLLSSRMGALAQKIGPRTPMTVGPIVAGVGIALMAGVEPGDTFATGVFPAVAVFGLGLSITVAPLTTAVLAAVNTGRAGIASGVNNAVARLGGLLAVAVLPAVVGLTGDAFARPDVFADGFRQAAWICAALAAGSGVVAFLTVRREVTPDCEPVGRHHCGLDAPVIEPDREEPVAA